jgi:uncharacterized membrane protein YfcA
MAALTATQMLLGAGSGSAVGFSLGLVGGGGSILAVPLLVYLVGVPSPHLAIGTSAVAVAANAALGLAGHARVGNVRWPCAGAFAAAGVAGAWFGARMGKAVDGESLLAAFAVMMVVVAGLMLRRREADVDRVVRLGRENAPKLVAAGLGVGLVSGFFGIGGGFLIVPGLIAASGMSMIQAVGSSLFSVGTFGATTAASYALDGLVDWRVAGLFIFGGVVGGIMGAGLAEHLAKQRGMLQRVFAGVIFVVAAYMLYRSFAG